MIWNVFRRVYVTFFPEVSEVIDFSEVTFLMKEILVTNKNKAINT